MQFQGNDELQHVNMNALVGIIRQLASLSAHAETLFADLFNEVQNEEQKLHSTLGVTNHDCMSKLFWFARFGSHNSPYRA